MKVSFLFLLSFIVVTTGCSSVNEYINTQQSQYLFSKDLGTLNKPNNFELRQARYKIPDLSGKKLVKSPDLYPPSIN